MSQYRIEDLPDFVNIPLETLARGDRQMTDADTSERVRAALHEAVHLLAAIIRRASVWKVEVSPTGRPKRGATGRVHAAERLPCDGAFIAYVGHAWEALHGDVALAAGDLRDGNRFADEAKKPRDELLSEAREFVLLGDGAFEVVAAAILAVMPKSGILEGRKLQRVIDTFRDVMHGADQETALAS